MYQNSFFHNSFSHNSFSESYPVFTPNRFEYTDLDAEKEKDPQLVEAAFRKKAKKNKRTLIVTVIALLLTVVFILVAFTVVAKKTPGSSTNSKPIYSRKCKDRCNIQVAETIPIGLAYPSGSPTHTKISDGMIDLLKMAEYSIDIASSYWSLKGSDIPGGPYPMANVGEDIFSGLVMAARRGIKIRIVQQLPNKYQPQKDTVELAKEENIEVHSLNMTQLLNNSGIIHSKMWLVDQKHIYLGSANMDWRSLTEVKELGFLTYNCSCLGTDMSKIFDVYWDLSVPGARVPNPWPKKYQTQFSKDNPLVLENSVGGPSRVFLGSSPPPFCPPKRTTDLNTILHVISTAKKFVYVAVMDYVTSIIYSPPRRFWGDLDNALRAAAYRGLDVRLLASKWSHTKAEQVYMLKSLKEFGGACLRSNGSLDIKQFVVPAGSQRIPFTRVNHNKYMVTDAAAYVGTSNWVGDYFVNTAGIGYVIHQDLSNKNIGTNQTVQEQVKRVFLRDWDSKYASPLS